MRMVVEEKTTTNSTVLNRINRRYFNCNRCPANRCENASGKRIPRDDRYKDHRG